VEMEALTAVSVAALTVYDMLKAIERGITIEGVRLLEKTGGGRGGGGREERGRDRRARSWSDGLRPNRPLVRIGRRLAARQVEQLLGAHRRGGPGSAEMQRHLRRDRQEAVGSRRLPTRASLRPVLRRSLRPPGAPVGGARAFREFPLAPAPARLTLSRRHSRRHSSDRGA
jgi:hypothetical protein